MRRLETCARRCSCWKQAKGKYCDVYGALDADSMPNSLYSGGTEDYVLPDWEMFVKQIATDIVKQQNPAK